MDFNISTEEHPLYEGVGLHGEEPLLHTTQYSPPVQNQYSYIPRSGGNRKRHYFQDQRMPSEGSSHSLWQARGIKAPNPNDQADVPMKSHQAAPRPISALIREDGPTSSTSVPADNETLGRFRDCAPFKGEPKEPEAKRRRIDSLVASPSSKGRAIRAQLGIEDIAAQEDAKKQCPAWMQLPTTKKSQKPLKKRRAPKRSKMIVQSDSEEDDEISPVGEMEEVLVSTTKLSGIQTDRGTSEQVYQSDAANTQSAPQQQVLVPSIFWTGSVVDLTTALPIPFGDKPFLQNATKHIKWSSCKHAYYRRTTLYILGHSTKCNLKPADVNVVFAHVFPNYLGSLSEMPKPRQMAAQLGEHSRSDYPLNQDWKELIGTAAVSHDWKTQCFEDCQKAVQRALGELGMRKNASTPCVKCLNHASEVLRQQSEGKYKYRAGKR